MSEAKLQIIAFLLNIQVEEAITECKEWCTGIEVDGMRMQMLKFAVDIAIVAQDEVNLKRAIESLDDVLKSSHKSKINRKKET